MELPRGIARNVLAITFSLGLASAVLSLGLGLLLLRLVLRAPRSVLLRDRGNQTVLLVLGLAGADAVHGAGFAVDLGWVVGWVVGEGGRGYVSFFEMVLLRITVFGLVACCWVMWGPVGSAGQLDGVSYGY